MSSQGFVCEQCYRYSYRQRSTKTTCCGKCRTNKSRGKEPRPYWEIDTKADKYEDFLQTALQHNPRLATRLQEIKSRYGRNAMLATIDTISLSHTGNSII